MNLPEKVTLIEVGPRDGFQMEDKFIPTDLKLKIINELVCAGLSRIQVTSFVHPKLMPQMADAEEVCLGLPETENVIYSALVLNSKGIERAYAAGLKHVDISISSSDTHSRKNAGMSLKKAMDQIKDMVSLAKTYNMKIYAGIQCAFGCAYEGRIPFTKILKMAKYIIDIKVDMFFLADTTGMANPLRINVMLRSLKPILNTTPVILHLHDTRGMGLANAAAALQCGVVHFDTAFGSMGGCPFIPGASGNISTEDTAFLMESMGIKTGIDIDRVAACSRRMEKFLNKSFPGKMHHLQ
ncbi:hydroxymethylglutaryl-CoA lyase [Candidatus Magnetomoraceae bacterium gMMP-15]